MSFRARRTPAVCPSDAVSQDPTEEAIDKLRKAFDAIMASDLRHEKKVEIALLMRQLVLITARIHIVMRSCAIEKDM